MNFLIFVRSECSCLGRIQRFGRCQIYLEDGIRWFCLGYIQAEFLHLNQIVSCEDQSGLGFGFLIAWFRLSFSVKCLWMSQFSLEIFLTLSHILAIQSYLYWFLDKKPSAATWLEEV